MRYTTKTEYGLICLVNLAKMGPAAKIAIKELAELESYPYSYVEKIFQSLRAAGIVHSFQGNQGGYALAKAVNEISLRDVIDAIEGATFDVFCHCADNEPEAREVICNHESACNLRSIWQKTKFMLDEFYGSITLADVAENKTFITICCHPEPKAKDPVHELDSSLCSE